ncbi:peroxidase 41-like [Phragmites australis]|uniref:peroxidase 41-like n=1 Tax=Phragmites australis TaxID=29695 RepID=UPI002D771118|nr:peroxidase 41-like [Phragmites australis]
MGTRPLHLSVLFLLLVAAAWLAVAEAKLVANYYRKTCPRAERIVTDVVSQKQLSHPTTAAGVLRVFFHDCFVSGCDASVLVAPNVFARSERDAVQSQSLPGDAFEALTRAKTALELECPGVVSCADVLAVAARDLVVMTGGPFYPLRLGRKDALASSPTAPDAELPLANSTVPRLIAMFSAKGFTIQELVALSGAHTLGFAHCKEFADRIFRGGSKGGGAAPPHDPTMNPAYAKGLQDACKNYLRDPTIAAFNDVMTPGKFDNMYFVNLQRGLGLLSTDQELWSDPRTRPIVQRYAANQTVFFADFARAIGKLSVQGVKTGRDGEVRRRCDMYNGHPVPRG